MLSKMAPSFMTFGTLYKHAPAPIQRLRCLILVQLKLVPSNERTNNRTNEQRNENDTMPRPHSLLGKPAPSFTLQNFSGENYTFTPGSTGRPAALFFYPKSGESAQI